MINQINTTITNSGINDVVFERAGAAQVINFIAETGYEHLTILVRNTAGKVVVRKTVEGIEKGNNTLPLKLDVVPGLYYVSVQNGSIWSTQKIFIR